MDRQFDLVVVGTGVTSSVASRCREAGWTVAVIDSRPFGGTCALRGCVPKKILVGAAEAVHAARDLADHGVPAATLTLDWPALMAFKRSLIGPTTERTEQAWAQMGVVQVHGRARFVGRSALAVGDDRLSARHVVIAAGAVPAPLGVPGEERLITSDAFLELDRLPREMVFVGGGYIAFEFAHVVARAGVAATIVHRGARPLEGFDPDLVEALLARTRALGIRVELETEVRGVEETAGGRLVVRGSRRGEERRFETDAAVLAENLLHGNRRRADYTGFASAVFTLPPLASVGLTEAAARAAGRRVRITHQDTAGWFHARRVGETASGFKVLIDEDTGLIVGAHLLGPHADEVINLFALAMRARIPADELRQVLYAYPTYGSDVRFML
jgi:glutathione reductase (NADPH)